jgi:RHS repeat-associated protein
VLEYRHPDWLGNVRFVSTTSRTLYYDTAYSPFGSRYASSGTADYSFTGMNQDTAANVYDFPAREYGIQGRWPSPDPAGMAAVDPTNPQSWNRYAYVHNNPLKTVDPTELCGEEDAVRRARSKRRLHAMDDPVCVDGGDLPNGGAGDGGIISTSTKSSRLLLYIGVQVCDGLVRD